jgi:pentatricopeptide repeat protein
MYYDVLRRSGEIEKNYQLSREIFNELERRGDAHMLSPDKATSIYSLMLRIMFAAGSPSSALDLYTQLSARGGVQNSSEMYVAMIKGLARCGQMERAENLFRDAVAVAERRTNKRDTNGRGDGARIPSSHTSSASSASSAAAAAAAASSCSFLSSSSSAATSTDEFDDTNNNNNNMTLSTTRRRRRRTSMLFVNDKEEEEEETLLDDLMFLESPMRREEQEDPMNWLPETIRYVGKMKFYLKNRGYGVAVLKNGDEIFIHDGRSFHFLKGNKKGKLRSMKHLLSLKDGVLFQNLFFFGSSTMC